MGMDGHICKIQYEWLVGRYKCMGVNLVSNVSVQTGLGSWSKIIQPRLSSAAQQDKVHPVLIICPWWIQGHRFMSIPDRNITQVSDDDLPGGARHTMVKFFDVLLTLSIC